MLHSETATRLAESGKTPQAHMPRSILGTEGRLAESERLQVWPDGTVIALCAAPDIDYPVGWMHRLPITRVRSHYLLYITTWGRVLQVPTNVLAQVSICRGPEDKREAKDAHNTRVAAGGRGATYSPVRSGTKFWPRAADRRLPGLLSQMPGCLCDSGPVDPRKREDLWLVVLAVSPASLDVLAMISLFRMKHETSPRFSEMPLLSINCRIALLSMILIRCAIFASMPYGSSRRNDTDLDEGCPFLPAGAGCMPVGPVVGWGSRCSSSAFRVNNHAPPNRHSTWTAITRGNTALST